MNKKDFASFVKEKRKELNLTQEELAEKMNVSRTVISKWEGGVSYPDLETAQLLARVVGVTPTELFEKSSINDDKPSINPALIIAPVVALIALIGVIVIPLATRDNITNPAGSQATNIETSVCIGEDPMDIIATEGKMYYKGLYNTISKVSQVGYLYNKADGQNGPTIVPLGINVEIYEAIYRAIHEKEIMETYQAVQPDYTVYFYDKDGNIKYQLGISEFCNWIMVGDGQNTIGVVGTSKEEIKQILDFCVPLGVADEEFEPLYRLYPELFNLPTDEGLTVFVSAYTNGTYECTLKAGTYSYNLAPSEADAKNQYGNYGIVGKDVTSTSMIGYKLLLPTKWIAVDFMKNILKSYKKDVKISIVPGGNAYSSQMLKEINADYIAEIQKLFN